MEEWKVIPEFPTYSVSNQGLVRNDERGRLIAIRRNGRGVCFVGLSKAGIQYQRSLGLLVATAFVLKERDREEFFHPIHVDGEQTNNNAWNLLWRPRWFAMEYSKQFSRPVGDHSLPVMEMRTREQYISAWDAAISFGLLASDVINAIVNRTVVWPTFQEFRWIEK